MPRTVRLALLVAGAVVLALLVRRIGPAVIAGLLLRIGWSFFAVSALYAVHLAIRAYGIWRSQPRAILPLRTVLRIRFAAESVEMLTFTGPFLAEPAKGWLLTRYGLTTAEAISAIAIEYLFYTLVSAWLAAAAVWLLLVRHTLPSFLHDTAVGILIVVFALTVGVIAAGVTGTGLIVPSVRRLALVAGRRAEAAAARIEPAERMLVGFLHDRPARVVELIVAETISHLLLGAEILVIFAALRLAFSPLDPWIIEGGVKFTNVAFFFIPGQFGAQEGVYSLVVRALALPAAVGVTLSLVRRLRALLVAAIGLLVLPKDRGAVASE